MKAILALCLTVLGRISRRTRVSVGIFERQRLRARMADSRCFSVSVTRHTVARLDVLEEDAAGDADWLSLERERLNVSDCYEHFRRRCVVHMVNQCQAVRF